MRTQLPNSEPAPGYWAKWHELKQARGYRSLQLSTHGWISSLPLTLLFLMLWPCWPLLHFLNVLSQVRLRQDSLFLLPGWECPPIRSSHH